MDQGGEGHGQKIDHEGGSGNMAQQFQWGCHSEIRLKAFQNEWMTEINAKGPGGKRCEDGLYLSGRMPVRADGFKQNKHAHCIQKGSDGCI